MATFHQLQKNKRIKKRKQSKAPALQKAPQKKAICIKVYITSPKKPNSSNKKVTKVLLSTKQKIIAYIPGEGHNLKQYSNVLIRGGRVPDLPGVRYKVVRGKFDLHSVMERRNCRSKYGTKLWYRGGYVPKKQFYSGKYI
jgi:small subunit ribosomal protein S12